MGKNGLKLTTNNSYQKTLAKAQSSEKEKIVFSFVYFQQPSFFGIGSCNTQWFCSLIDRLKDLSSISYEELNVLNLRNSKTLRYHPVNWNAKNIPIKKNDLNLPSNIISNEEEFPFYQISVSKTKGRIIGFLYENTFYIVLLDSNHNIHPSKKDNYQIQPTTVGLSEYDDLISKLKKYNKLEDINRQLPENIIYRDKDFYKEYIKLCEEYSLREIFENGIYSLCNNS